ncbi:MAG: terminase gpA endonuclease subunit [Woeseiaceae bacterium]
MSAIAYEQSKHTASHLRAKVWNNDCANDMPPPSAMTDTRQACDGGLLRFLQICFPDAFPLAMSPDHLRIISEIERMICDGGLKAIAAPRGSGKTSIILRSAMWAILTGRRRYVCIVAADEGSAVSNLNTIKIEINHNQQLLEHYAYETWCIRQLGNEPRRAATQHFSGNATGVEYGKHSLNFGLIPDSVTSGATITTAGITGRIRGQQSTTLDGEIIRPDFVICDDPQTKQSAASPSQCKKRHETMMGDVLGMAGPGVKISGFCTCTVIYQNDLADRILDRKLSADWNGDKIAMIQSWPKWMEGWDEYNQLRIEELVNEEPSAKSRQFVLEHFDQLHEGSQVYWEERKGESDVSALQHAMDLFYRDQGVFASEFQNNPLDEFHAPPYDINIENLCRRTTGMPRGRVPDDIDKITAFIDTQRELLYYVVIAWSNTGRAYVIDYGACPDQQRHYWTKINVGYPLSAIFGDDFETYLRSGLDWLLEAILDNEYTTESGGKVMVDRLAIDARWGESTHVIRKLCRESKFRARLHPSMGQYIGANSKPWMKIKSEVKTSKGRKGVHAKLKVPTEGGRYELIYDTNYWKSFVADRLLCSSGSPKAIVLFDAKPHLHRMFAEHCANEEPFRVIGKTNNEVVEWKQRASGSPENDYWDCLVGNAALASTIGVETHSGNRKSGLDMSKTIEAILKKKPPNQFFRDR